MKDSRVHHRIAAVRPGNGVHGKAGGPQGREREQHAGAEQQQDAVAVGGRPLEHVSQPVAERHDPEPGQQRIGEEPGQVADRTGGEQQAGCHRPAAFARNQHRKQGMAGHDRHAHRQHGPAWQPQQRRQQQEPAADRPDHLQEQERPGEIEGEGDHRQFEQDQPQAAQREEAREGGQVRVRALQVHGGSREEYEGRRAQVGDPARHEQRRRGLGQIRRLRGQRADVEVVAHVVEHHQHDHQAAEPVHDPDAPAAYARGGVAGGVHRGGRGGHAGCGRGRERNRTPALGAARRAGVMWPRVANPGRGDAVPVSPPETSGCKACRR